MVITRILKYGRIISNKGRVRINMQCHIKKCTTQVTAEEFGQKSPATPLRADNNTASCIMQGTTRQKRSKAIDIRLYWLNIRVIQKMFKVYWTPVKMELADYFSKHCTASHVKETIYILMNLIVQELSVHVTQYCFNE